MIWLRYVTFAEVPAYEAKGWTIRDQLDCHHGFYGVLMIYEGDDEPC